jgi:hypothetical protein
MPIIQVTIFLKYIFWNIPRRTFIIFNFNTYCNSRHNVYCMTRCTKYGSIWGVQWPRRTSIQKSLPDDGPMRQKHVAGNKYSIVNYSLIINNFVVATANLTIYLHISFNKSKADLHKPWSEDPVLPNISYDLTYLMHLWQMTVTCIRVCLVNVLFAMWCSL